MKKKIAILLTATFCCVGLIACGTNEVENANPVETVETTEVVSVTEEVEPTKDVEPTKEVESEIVEEISEEVLVETEEVQNDDVEIIEEVVEEDVQPTYTYTDISETKYAKSTVNVRDLPDKSGNKLGSFSQNDEVQVTGQCNETNWYRIDYNGQVAYVSDSLLVNEKVEVTVANETLGADSGSTQKATGKPKLSDSYAYDVWYDMGDYAFILKHERDMNMNNLESDAAVAAALSERYPGYTICRKAGFPTADGYVWYDYWWDGAGGFSGTAFVKTYNVPW